MPAAVPAVVPTAMPSDTFSDAEIQAMIRSGDLPADFEEFNFPDPGDLMPMHSGLTGVGVGLGLEPSTNPYGADFAVPLCSDLLLRLEEMPPDAREGKIAELKTMSAERLERENITAQNYYVLNHLGLNDAQKETLWGGAVAPPAKRKARKQGQRKGKGRGKRARKEVEEESESEEMDGEDEAEGETDPSTEQGKQKEKAVKTAPQAAKSKASSAWAEKARTFLGNKEYGPKWLALLALWWKREEDAGFESPMSKCRLNAVDVSAGIAHAVNDRPEHTQQRYVPRKWATGFQEHGIIPQASTMQRISGSDTGGGG
jgi:hypothetical protein